MQPVIVTSMGSLERTAFALLASGVIAAYVSACGGSGGDSPSRVGRTTIASGETGQAEGRAFLKSDSDRDRDDHARSVSHDDEDELVSAQRSGSTASERAAVRKIVRAYYAAASAGDGAAGCALLSSTLASSLSPSRTGGSARTCGEALSRLFAVQRPHLAAEDARTMVLTGVHVHRDVAFVTLGFRAAPEGELVLQREGGSWKLNALFDSGLP